MEKLILLLALIFMMGCGGSSYKSPISPDINISAEGVDQSYSLLPFSDEGTLQMASKSDENAQLLETGLLHHGLKEGTWINYSNKFNRQNLETIYNYKDGFKHGPYLIMENGSQLKEQGYFYEGKLDGQRMVYSRGKLVELVNYNDGLMHGITTKYYEDGTTKKEEGLYQYGQREGTHLWFDQEGNVKIELTYKNGKQVN